MNGHPDLGESPVTTGHPEPNGSKWTARFIWFEPPRITLASETEPVLAPGLGDRFGLFRRALHLDAVPGRVPARVWADARYVLYVNDAEVGRGPVRGNPRQPHHDTYDLTPLLTVGDNVIAIVARHYGHATAWWTPVPPTYTLGAGCLLFEASVGGTLVTSDASWRAHAGDAWTAPGSDSDVANQPMECFDARALAADWATTAFDDSTWAAATEIRPMHTGAHSQDQRAPVPPFGPMSPRPVPQLVGERRAAQRTAHRSVDAGLGAEPATAALDALRAGDGTATTVHTFDFGTVVAGTMRFSLAAPAGTRAAVAFTEHVDADGVPVTLGEHNGFAVTADGSERTFETFDLVGARYAVVAVEGGPANESTAEPALEVQERHRPRPAGASFECSDPALARIHAIGLRTVDLCALDAYVDCPTREQRAWTGDSVVHQMVDLATNPDWSLARWHPQMAAVPRADGMLPMAVASDFEAEDRAVIPDWALHWLRAVHNLYRHTGDGDLIAALLPVAERMLRWFEAHLGTDGLVHDVTGWTLIDWSSVYSSGTSSALNALWARGLEDFAEMAEWLGNAGSAAWARARYDGVATGFDAFWDDDRGVYVDHLVDGVARRVAAQHGGAAALAAGLVPAERAGRVIDRLLDRRRLIRHSWCMDTVTLEGGSAGMAWLAFGYPEPDWDVEEQMVEAQPFFRYVLHDGVARYGRADLIAGLCRDWQVFVDAGATSWPECWRGGTNCHGWSSTPTRDLIVHTLGITPGTPGYDTVRVAPRLGDLEWARATVPTPHGFVTVEAHADGRVEVDSPVPHEIA